MIRAWLVALAWLTCGLAAAREPEAKPLGFVRLLNSVVPGSGNLECRIDRRNIRPEGYRSGDVTGGIALESGRHVVSLRRDGVMTGRVAVQVEAGETTMLVAFADLLPATERRPEGWKIRLLKVGQHDAVDRPMISLVSVCRNPELEVEVRQPDKSWQKHRLERLQVSRVMLRQSRGAIRLRCGGLDLSAIPAVSAGNLVVVLYDTPEGRILSKFYLDYRYSGAG